MTRFGGAVVVSSEEQSSRLPLQPLLSRGVVGVATHLVAAMGSPLKKQRRRSLRQE